jgi:uncharacterized protein (TIGR02996 family)
VTDHAAFLAAIVAAPDDDLPRLVLADWLDEHGQPARAEFIRVQCEIARTENFPGERFCTRANAQLRTGVKDCVSSKCPSCKLRRRQWALWRRHGCDWQGEVIKIVIEPAVRDALETGVPMNDHWTMPPRIGPVEFRRGFPSDLSCTWETWSRHAAALLAACPLTGKDSLVRLTDAPRVTVVGFEPVAVQNLFCLAGLEGRATDGRTAGRTFGPSRGSTFGRTDGPWQPVTGWTLPQLGLTQDTDRIPARVLHLLAAEWPGVHFELPDTGIDVQAVRGQINRGLADLRARGIECGDVGNIEITPG